AACLAVVICHSLMYDERVDHVVDAATGWTKLLSYGRLGVPVFFVISGYCIAATAEATRRRDGNIADYFLRRFRRIFPPYWAVLITSAIIIALFDLLIAPCLITSQPRMESRPWWFSISQWFGNITLTETWRWHLF